MNFDWTKYLLGGLIIIFLDHILLQHLSLWGIHFDAILLYLVWTLPDLKKPKPSIFMDYSRFFKMHSTIPGGLCSLAKL